MKKALALVLALVLALSMGVSAFAELVELDRVRPEEDEPAELVVFDMQEEEYLVYTRPIITEDDAKLGKDFVTYIALDPTVPYVDVKLTANGNLDAELVEFDPETMVALGALNLTYSVMYKGEVLEAPYTLKEVAEDVYLEAADAEIDILTIDNFTGWSYNDAQTLAGLIRADKKVSKGIVDVECEQYVNIIKLTIENNFSAHYTEGTLKIEATNAANKKAYATTIELINDVCIFEYEEVKYAAENNEDGATLQLGAAGYSDYVTDEYGYDAGDNKYDEDYLRTWEDALVVSTTAFRAIEGKDLTLDVLSDDDMEISVTLKEIAKGQKGVNFFAWGDLEIDDKDDNDGDQPDYANDELVAASFGFMGDQIIKGEFEIVVDLPIDYYELREFFGEKVEEDDIVTYYVLKNGVAFDSFTVDYMTYDPSENVELVIKGENEKLGWYTIALEAPAAEVEGEENPNTGAESVVGVVAALAVVSLASAAAVSLKK
ncbi:MAG: hypothetical protein IJA05_05730 [Oscillospiraceae bacterium]|nr:hypothetical protein [Oscillospiraceae bacterium]